MKCWIVWFKDCWPGADVVCYVTGRTRAQAHSMAMNSWSDASGLKDSTGYKNIRSRRAPEFDGVRLPYPMDLEGALREKGNQARDRFFGVTVKS